MNRPTPTRLKLLAGNPGKHKINHREPQPPPVLKLPPCPLYLTGEARSYWEEQGPILVESGVLTKPDLPAFALLCEAFGRWRNLSERIKKAGLTTQWGKSRSINPLTRLQAEAFRDYRMMASEFGVTPSSRARVVGVGTQAKEEDSLLDA